jgi:uncharacterized protein
MEQLVKKEQLNELFDLYEPLFTEKQITYFKHYYHEDFSLNEIANLYQLSRNAIYDHIKKVEEGLLVYEQKLGFLKLQKKRLELISKFEKTQDMKFIKQLRKLDE